MYELFKSTMLTEQEYTFTLSVDELNVILPGLGELKANRSWVLISKINDSLMIPEREVPNGNSGLQESRNEGENHPGAELERDLQLVGESSREGSDQ